MLVDTLLTVREARALADWVVLHDRTVEQMRKQVTPEALNNGVRARFPGQIADTVALAEPLGAAQFELEGLPLVVVEAGHTDTLDTTSQYVPDLGLIVSGDVAYNHGHMFVGATTADSRAEWITALDRRAALNPHAVVAGHKDSTQGNPPSILSESRDYLEYYRQLREAAASDQDLFDAMVSRYPDWVSRQQFLLVG